MAGPKAYRQGLGDAYPPGDFRRYLLNEEFLLNNAFDLHLHSTASDGTYSPAKLAKACLQQGLKAVCLTDHDSLAGQKSFHASLAKLGYEGPKLYGSEISVDFKGEEVHLLSYFDEQGARQFARVLEEQRQLRAVRNQSLAERLIQLGYAINYEQLKKRHSLVGRPHFAMALVEAGYFATVDEAFAKLLGNGQAAYIPKKKFSIFRAIEEVAAANGISALAHPALYGYFPEPTEAALEQSTFQKLKELKAAGLAALEVWHGDCTPAEIAQISAYALCLGLARTGGSDYHGPYRSRKLYKSGEFELKKEILVVAAALFSEDKLFLACRGEGQYLAGRYEFPGGKVETGESLQEALQRELQEELGLNVDSAEIPDEPEFIIIDEREDLRLNLAIFKINLSAQRDFKLSVHSAAGFYYPEAALDKLPIIEINRQVLERFRADHNRNLGS
ncbi:MAG: NUDIX domain-containing protein [Eubacteriales bacterium]|nr:NUDIX domain-containing protein [Eubacteriales bacterium]